jgi:hypothetical protein
MPDSILYPSVQANENSVGTVDWELGFEDVFADDNGFVYVPLSDGEQSHYLVATGFGFAIPSGATITSIVVRIGRKANIAGSGDYPDLILESVKLVRNGVIMGTDQPGPPSAFPSSEGVSQHGDQGGEDGLWGLSWAESDINDADFGVAVSVSATGGIYPANAEVDYITIQVNYTIPDIEPSPTAVDVGVVSAIRRASLRSQRGRSAIVGPLTDESPTATDMAFVEIVSAQRRFAGARSRFVNATPGSSSIFAEAAFTESVWLEQIVAPIRPRGMHALRPLAYLVQVDLPAGNGECECNPGGAVLVGFAYGAVLVSVTNYSLGVGQYGATLVSQGFGRAVIVSVCEC